MDKAWMKEFLTEFLGYLAERNTLDEMATGDIMESYETLRAVIEDGLEQCDD